MCSDCQVALHTAGRDGSQGQGTWASERAAPRSCSEEHWVVCRLDVLASADSQVGIFRLTSTRRDFESFTRLKVSSRNAQNSVGKVLGTNAYATSIPENMFYFKRFGSLGGHI